MMIELINDAGMEEALLGLGLSYGLTSDISAYEYYRRLGCIDSEEDELLGRLRKVAKSLAKKDGGHNCFLEQIVLWLDIKAPRYWWQQFDRYKVGTARLSESTMHTIGKRDLTPDDFENGAEIPDEYFTFINRLDRLNRKSFLLESFLQRRICLISMKALKNMYFQRRSHALSEWQTFCDFCEKDVPYFKEWFL